MYLRFVNISKGPHLCGGKKHFLMELGTTFVPQLSGCAVSDKYNLIGEFSVIVTFPKKFEIQFKEILSHSKTRSMHGRMSEMNSRDSTVDTNMSV